MGISSRYITPEDYNLLEGSLLLDEHHNETPVSFFYEEGTVCSVFEDESGPVLFVRAKTMGLVIVLDIQFLDNKDAKRNMRTMLAGFPGISEKAKENGFYGFMFASTVSLLRKFCCKRLGFTEYDEQLLVKVL